MLKVVSPFFFFLLERKYKAIVKFFFYKYLNRLYVSTKLKISRDASIFIQKQNVGYIFHDC